MGVIMEIQNKKQKDHFVQPCTNNYENLYKRDNSLR